MINLNLILLSCGDIEQNPGPYNIYIQSELSNLATSLQGAADGPIYFNKTGSVINAKSSENSSVILNMGFPYQFVDGSVVYLQSGYISSPQQIPWIYNYSALGSYPPRVHAHKTAPHSRHKLNIGSKQHPHQSAEGNRPPNHSRSSMPM